MGVNLSKKGFPFVKKPTIQDDNDSGMDVINWSSIQNKPSEFPPITHTHEVSEILKDVTDI